jgi:hypothetical protein
MNENPNPESSASQNKRILAYMKAGHRITGLDALRLFGVLSFTRRICDIEEILGYPPQRQRIQVENRYGKMIWVNEYWLEPETAQ